MDLKILSLNVGLSTTFPGLTTLVTANNIDLLLLQEIRVFNEQLNLLFNRLGYQAEVNIDPNEPYRPGTAIVWRKSLPMEDIIPLVTCRAQAAVIGQYVVFNIYAPSGSDKRQERNFFFSQDMFRAFNLFTHAHYIFAGDFNCVLSPLDIENGVGFNTKFCASLKDLVTSFDLIDAFRAKFPSSNEYTFFRPGKSASRLDRFYISSSIALSWDISHIASLSDHFAVHLKIKLNIFLQDHSKTGKTTYWKLNTSILSDDQFLPSFKCFWTDISKQKPSFDDVAEWWDKAAKPAIKDFCLGLSKHRSLTRKSTIRFLLSYLKVVTADKNWTEVARVKDELNKIFLSDSMGIIVRSRYQQNAEEERGSIFHSAREAKNAKNNWKALKINGKVVQNKEIIESHVKGFFTALFNGHHNSQLQNTGVPFAPNYSKLGLFLDGLDTLDDQASIFMHRKIDFDELDDILKHCKNNKSPGLNGLPYEFYKAVWPVIGSDLLEIFQTE